MAQYRFGLCIQNGIGVAKDQREAVRWLRMAAEQGYAEAQYNLGLHTNMAKALPKTSARRCAGFAWRLIREYAWRAQFNLGLHTTLAVGVAKDPNARRCAGFAWRRNQGDACGANLIWADAYYHGEGVAKDSERGGTLVSHGGGAGIYVGATYFGLCIRMAKALPRTSARRCAGFAWRRKAGLATDAQYNLGVGHTGTWRRRCRRQDVRRCAGIAWRLKQGLAKAQTRFGLCIRHWQRRCQRPAQGGALVSHGGGAGTCGGAKYSWALAYWTGEGVAKDPREAVRWWRMAAEQGHAAAQASLGSCILAWRRRYHG